MPWRRKTGAGRSGGGRVTRPERRRSGRTERLIAVMQRRTAGEGDESTRRACSWHGLGASGSLALAAAGVTCSCGDAALTGRYHWSGGGVVVLLLPLCSPTGRIAWCFFFFQAEDGIRDWSVTGVQTCALPI